jgi:D-sedoheptulose 7-phosphate isomerase
MRTEELLQNLLNRHPELSHAARDISSGYEIIRSSYEKGGKLLVCGNGGSAADADHMVGELMKKFSIKRAIPESVHSYLVKEFGERGEYLAKNLEGALPAISLNGHSALSSAFSNDVDAELIYAQQVVGYGNKDDVLLGISTSGNARNVTAAMLVARSKGMKVIGLVGRDGGEFNMYCDVLINVGGNSTPQIQELHLPVYHTLCEMLEFHFFGNAK